MQEIPKLVTGSAKTKSAKEAMKSAESATVATASAMTAAGLLGLPAASFFGAFNTVQLITMQPYLGSDMPPNAANFLQSIDKLMRGGPLNPASYINKLFKDPSLKTSPVMKRQLLSSLLNENLVSQMVT